MTSRKNRVKPLRFADEEPHREEATEELKLEEGTGKTRAKKELTSEIPADMPHEFIVGEHSEFDKEQPNVSVAVAVGGKRKRKARPQ